MLDFEFRLVTDGFLDRVVLLTMLVRTIDDITAAPSCFLPMF